MRAELESNIYDARDEDDQVDVRCFPERNTVLPGGTKG